MVGLMEMLEQQQSLAASVGQTASKPRLQMSDQASGIPRVAIIGGGLAGMAAAAALAQRGGLVTLFEAKQKLGGRAGSFVDPESGETIDHCQHVTMGCCTNFADFCRRTGIDQSLARHEVLHFFGLDAKRSDFAASKWLPPPLHLAPAFLRLKHLSWRDKWCIARGTLQLMRAKPQRENPAELTIGKWLVQAQQTEAAIDRYWKVVLESALGETLDRASFSSARKVFVDGFLGHRDACTVFTPSVTLHQLYDVQVADWLVGHQVDIRRGQAIAGLEFGMRSVQAVRLASGEELPFDDVILAAPWARVGVLLPVEIRREIPGLETTLAQTATAPIMAVHLWFDRPIMPLAHAVLVGKLAQWIFARPAGADEHYYQVVISGCHELVGEPRDASLLRVLVDLAEVWPAVNNAKLLRSRLICDPQAVFSPRPGLDGVRPAQTTPIPNLFLAGDWTATGWPATMEGAVRSGYLAAEGVLRRWGAPERILIPDLPRQGLSRWLVG
jgi:squalene-associated FAD-dependent desaturase